MSYKEFKKFSNRESPIFIIGNNRSGTSLLRLILTCHEQIIIPPESHFMLWNYDKYHLWKPIDGYNNILSDVIASTKFETWGIRRDELESFLHQRKPLSYSEFIADIYIYYGLKNNKTSAKLWGDKNSLWTEKLHTMYALFKKAKFIHIIRDGRDIAASYIKLNQSKNGNNKYFPKLPTNVEKIAELWRKNINAVTDFLSKIPAQNCIQVKYEDLILHNEDIISNLLNFLGLPLSQSVFSYYEINKIKNYEPKEFLDWKEKLNQPLDKSNIGKYRQELKQLEIEKFESIASDVLIKHGYK